MAIRTPISWLGARDIGGLLFGRSFFLAEHDRVKPVEARGNLAWFRQVAFSWQCSWRNDAEQAPSG